MRLARDGMRVQKLLPQFKTAVAFAVVRNVNWDAFRILVGQIPCGITNQARRFSQAAALHRRQKGERWFALRQGGGIEFSLRPVLPLLRRTDFAGGGLPCGDIEAETANVLRHDVFQCFTFSYIVMKWVSKS